MTTLVATKPVCLPQKVVRMLDQQFWQWGCDVKHPTGNLLICFGFRRIPPPSNDSSSSSVYVLEIDPSKRVVLRGSAVFYGNDRLGGLLIKRFDSQLYGTPTARLQELPHTPDCLLPLERPQKTDPQSSKLASELFYWIAQYEAWILGNFGAKYVNECLKLRGKQPYVEMSTSKNQWLMLADKFG